jgi:GH15 family glucan-1,4-alpha-glucosidase
MYKKIEDYGLIGDMHGVALVSKDGSIDYCCLPHIDSPTVFASILDEKRGGYFSITPKGKYKVSQKYLPATNILSTTFETLTGTVEVIDFMAVSLKSDLYEKEKHEICRLIKGIEGNVDLKIECHPRPNYAQDLPEITKKGNRYLIRSKQDAFTLIIKGKHSDSVVDNNGISIETSISAGEEEMFMFIYGIKETAEINPNVLEETKDFWQKWLSNCESGRCRIFGEYDQLIKRSLLALKLLTFAPTGAVAAAATTSLPEVIGGERNWDYRFTWLRDSSFTLKALFSVGHISETEKYVHWLQSIYRKYGKKKLQIMYGLDGRSKLDEKELKHLDGYKGSRPVRIGNDAYNQKQFDIYGEIMDSALRLSDYAGRIDEELWPFFRRVCNHAVADWRNPDTCIWEVRSGPYHFVYSKMMCWVALDRGIKIARRYGFEGEIEIWEKIAQEIKNEVIEKGFNPELNSFVQHYETKALDASLLAMPLMGFLPIKDPKVQGTIAAIIKYLARDGFLLRYNLGETDDGLLGEEGAFLFCNFWLVECLALSGKIDQAKDLLKKTISAANHLGLFSEEYDFKNKQSLGNFPQAFTHIGLINAVNTILAAEHPTYDQKAKVTFIQKLKKLIPIKLVLNFSKEVTKESTATIAADIKKGFNYMQGAFFDVPTGRVNYEAMKKSEAYQNHLTLSKKLNAFDLSLLKTDQQKKAFWINIYNIIIIQGVIELDVQNSVKEVSNFFRRISYNIGGYNFTPDNIEFGILRKNAAHPLLKLREFGWFDKRKKLQIEKADPRIHFALVCASSSCPPIEFYHPEKIDEQLDLAARSFLNRRGAVLDKEKKILYLSQIFMWFKSDFGDVVKFILPYLNEETQKYIQANRRDLKIDYLPYDWNLNRSLR